MRPAEEEESLLACLTPTTTHTRTQPHVLSNTAVRALNVAVRFVNAALWYPAVDRKVPVRCAVSYLLDVLANQQERVGSVINYCVFLAILPGNNFYNNDKRRNKFCHYLTAFITVNVAGRQCRLYCLPPGGTVLCRGTPNGEWKADEFEPVMEVVNCIR